VDNSEASRNGDYVPSRWEAQQDAVNLIFSAKTGANPESSVGLMSMGGSTPEILTTLTTDIGKVLDGLHRTKIKGNSHFVTGINVAAVRHNRICHVQRLTTERSSPSNTGRTSHRSNG
jgi:26S proteasome regulatory subunit N10